VLIENNLLQHEQTRNDVSSASNVDQLHARGYLPLRMGKTATIALAFRLPADLVARIDAYAARLSNETPGLEITRVIAVKALLTQALDALGIQAPSPSGLRKGR
jgi:hypothetical protein